jgi:uncharacterized membrane protein
MERIEKTIEVNATVSQVYNQWTHFEEFPQFMEGVQDVRQLDAKHLHWVARIAGKQKEWDAEIVEQVPDQRIAWRSTEGAPNAGTITFQAKADHTMMTLRLEYEPQGVMEKAGSAMGLVSQRVEADLKRFQQLLQQRGTQTGSSRGDENAMKRAPDADYDSSGMSGLK